MKYIKNDTQSFWYMCFLYVSGICVFLVRYNTTKSCAISLNTRARLHTRSYIIKLHIKTMLHANTHVTGVLNSFPRPNGVGLYPGLSAISQAALFKGLKGFITRTPNVNLCIGISMSKYLLIPPTAFYLKSERASE